jgi:hypothetical protein
MKAKEDESKRLNKPNSKNPKMNIRAMSNE